MGRDFSISIVFLVYFVTITIQQPGCGISCADGCGTKGHYSCGFLWQSCCSCPAGQSIACDSSSHLDSCYNCPVGQASYSGCDCYSCPAGQYSSSPGNPSCSLTNAGCLDSGSGGSTASCPNSCPAGQYSPAGSTSCFYCPTGQYSSSAGSSSCTLCSPGYFMPYTGYFMPNNTQLHIVITLDILEPKLLPT